MNCWGNCFTLRKKKVADLAVGVGESWIGDLTDDEIKSIFSLSK